MRTTSNLPEDAVDKLDYYASLRLGTGSIQLDEATGGLSPGSLWVITGGGGDARRALLAFLISATARAGRRVTVVSGAWMEESILTESLGQGHGFTPGGNRASDNETALSVLAPIWKAARASGIGPDGDIASLVQAELSWPCAIDLLVLDRPDLIRSELDIGLASDVDLRLPLISQMLQLSRRRRCQVVVSLPCLEAVQAIGTGLDFEDCSISMDDGDIRADGLRGTVEKNGRSSRIAFEKVGGKWADAVDFLFPGGQHDLSHDHEETP